MTTELAQDTLTGEQVLEQRIRRVSVIVSDKVIIVDQTPVKWQQELDIPVHMRALQWDGINQKGHIEWLQGPNTQISTEDWKQYVYPFVQAHAAEYQRMVQEDYASRNKQMLEYNSEEKIYERLRNMRNKKLSETDYLVLPDYPINEDSLQAVKTYRQSLRDITDQKGAPWNPTGDNIPWPEMPEIVSATE